MTESIQQRVLARVAAIRDVLGNATKGEWLTDGSWIHADFPPEDDGDSLAAKGNGVDNARAIALAHNIILDDLDAIEALAKLAGRLEASSRTSHAAAINQILSRWMERRTGIEVIR